MNQAAEWLKLISSKILKGRFEMTERLRRDFECVDLDYNAFYPGEVKLEALENLLNAPEQPDEYQVFFYHSDHLGSSSFITDINGDATQHLQYLPFGEDFVHQQNTAAYYTPYTFSGKERDVETNLSYFGARYYEAGLSVWLSVDPLADHPDNIKWSSYNYAYSNPVKFIDPDGRIPIIPILMGMWAAAEVALSAFDAYETGKTLLDEDKSAEEKVLTGGLFLLGVVIPGGGYTQLPNLTKWGIKSHQAAQVINHKAQKATNLLFGRNNQTNIRLGGVHSRNEANAIGETIVGELKYHEKYGSYIGERIIKNKEGEFKITYRGPTNKANSKYASTGTQANIEIRMKNSQGEWKLQKNVHINVAD